jgi:hypothetical protein
MYDYNIDRFIKFILLYYIIYYIYLYMSSYPFILRHNYYIYLIIKYLSLRKYLSI